jgi:predicted ATPase
VAVQRCWRWRLLRRPSQPALLERDGVLAELRDALAKAAAGRGRLALVTGEAGVGKTAVVQAFCNELDRNVRVFTGACDPLFTPRPLGPFADIADDAGGELAAVLERQGSAHDLASALLAEANAWRPAIFVLEDVHWADEATLDVLRLLARKIERARVSAILRKLDVSSRGEAVAEARQLGLVEDRQSET